MRKILYAAGVAVCALLVLQPYHLLAGKGKQRPQPYTISGDISGMPEQTIVLELVRANDSMKVVDSQHSDAAGHFAFSGTLTEPGFYRLHFTQDRFVLLSIEKGDVKVSGTWPLADYAVSGSRPSVALKMFIDSLRSGIGRLNRMFAVADSIKNTGDAGGYATAFKLATDSKATFVQSIKKYCDTIPYEPNAILSVRMLDPKEEFAFMEGFAKTLEKKFPGTALTTDYARFIDMVKASMPQPTEVGNNAPELTLQDLNGKNVSLSSYRGKYVLVDFWASWCGPCRAENPNVVAAYGKYKDKNFTILGVSLDNKKEPWEKAVDHDHLTWTHVSDLKGWQSGAAAKYGVHSIPANFLIDPKGVIIAKNLRGPELDNKLEEVLK